MGNVLLFAIPKFEPPAECSSSAAADFSHVTPWAAEHLRKLRQERQKLHAGILERAALVATVFGMPELAAMNASQASNALIELVKRQDVRAVLDDYWRRAAATRMAS
jgi:hypothetical protein